ncbi:GNAT family N-acetyltransferase [Actinomycetospora sp. Odt1-22]|uniref:GNAT family N-acetyltransferase n=1 Tax=Actinomycetospora termitidis TaxID=3053470 RepID=A0ABT7M114_9PSEU|nr:GNAT family N-acetyltransferase [Actinomycetospora sp. Odt1-22]MDL5154344.1 GNAT family N-acetyltransferase [Actinomycetospora sp. Odt1-22]
MHRARLDDMTPRDLYAVLALRVEVFVVEQECAYPELDGLDLEAEHWWSRAAGGELTACLRVLAEPDGTTRIGRVVSAPGFRGTGAGAALFGAALSSTTGPVVLGAQVRSQGFYERFGFAVSGPGYDEDGIPHVPMLRSATADAQAAGGSSGA